MEGQQHRVLLPKDVSPSHYVIHLTPNFTDFTFKGEEIVSVKVRSVNFRSAEAHNTKMIRTGVLFHYQDRGARTQGVEDQYRLF